MPSRPQRFGSVRLVATAFEPQRVDPLLSPDCGAEGVHNSQTQRCSWGELVVEMPSKYIAYARSMQDRFCSVPNNL